jgi:hypothetical protein
MTWRPVLPSQSMERWDADSEPFDAADTAIVKLLSPRYGFE